MKRRVVITGLGLVTPLACGVEETWGKILEGKSGIRKIDKFDTFDVPCKIAGQLPKVGEEHGFNPDDWVSAKEQRRVDNFIIYGVAACTQAVEDSGWKPQDEESQCRTGVLVGSGIGGLKYIEDSTIIIHEQGVRKLSPFFIPGSLINLVSGHVSIKYGFKGPNHAVVTACSTGAHAIGDAARMIEYGDADVMVAGGAEAAICRGGIGGFTAARAMSTSFNDQPEKASRPWDKDRDGFVMGEGAGSVVLEEYEHAKKRGAKIYAELIGYGLSGDAYHITSPEPTGSGGYRSMKMALERSGLKTSDIGYINAHGTSTALGDAIEFNAVKRLFATDCGLLSMSSTKSSIGHLLGAAGCVEAIFCILAMRDGVAPPTLNLENLSEDCHGINLVPLVAQKREIKAALSNSFGFGGTNASLVMKKV